MNNQDMNNLDVYTIVYEKPIDMNVDIMKGIALVKNPAIESNFIYLNKLKDLKLSEINIEQRMIYGPAMIPGKEILRYLEEDDYYYKIVFEAEHIVNFSIDFIENQKNLKINSEHNQDQFLDDISITENWLVMDKNNDKSNVLGLDVVDGTLMIGMHINSDEILEDVKTGKYQGFSVEGFFTHVLLSDEKLKELRSEKLMAEFLNSFNDEDITNEEIDIIIKDIEKIIK